MAMENPPVPAPEAAPSPPAASPETTPNPPPGAPVNAPLDGEATELVLQLSIWQHPFVQNVLPFLTSLVLHASLIVIGMLALRAAGELRQRVMNQPREQIIIPDADMPMDGPEGGVQNPGLGTDATRAAAQDKFPEVPKDSQGLAEKAGPSLVPALMGGGSNEGDVPGIIAQGAGGLGVGAGVGTGTGDGSGQLAPFGIPGGGGGLAPKASFIGSRGNAKRIAYVCDASGSMLDMFDSLRVQLRSSIDRLRPIQSFNVIFFKDEGVATVDKSSLLPATPENKHKAFEFLNDFDPRGQTNPLPSLELAFKQGPELVYILTDGNFPDNDAVIRLCQQKNASKRIKINTIAFVPKSSRNDPQKLEFVKVLKQIAEENGGTCRMVTDDDMAQ